MATTPHFFKKNEPILPNILHFYEDKNKGKLPFYEDKKHRQGNISLPMFYLLNHSS